MKLHPENYKFQVIGKPAGNLTRWELKGGEGIKPAGNSNRWELNGGRGE